MIENIEYKYRKGCENISTSVVTGELQQALKNLANEFNEQGGVLVIKINGVDSFEVDFKNISASLRTKMMSAVFGT